MKNYNLLKRNEGTAAVEFALIVPMLFLVLSGIFNFGLICIKQNQLTSVINAGMLYAIKNNSSMTNIQTQMTSATNMSPLTVSATQFCGCSDGTTVSCSSACGGSASKATYVNVTASSTVTLYALNFVLTNPFPISLTGIIRVG